MQVVFEWVLHCMNEESGRVFFKYSFIRGGEVIAECIVDDVYICGEEKRRNRRWDGPWSDRIRELT